ncbi:glycosyltransferase family 2 protein [Shewanella putrefaciens]|nr:glycosyltransferase family 2 protein [Shewanella putrefaciens]
MKDVVKVSIIIPVCDRLDKLIKTIESVEQQSFQNFELIIVENNSVNPELIASFVNSLDMNVKYYSMDICNNTNVARNFGADNSSGEFIAFLDSDDLWDSTHLERSLSFLESTKSEFVYGGARIFDGNVYKIRKARDLNRFESPVDYILGFCGGYAQTSSYILQRQSFNLVRWDEELKRSQDLDFFIRAARALKYCCLPTITVTIVWLRDEKRGFNIPASLKFFSKYRNTMKLSTKLRFFLILLKISIMTKDSYLLKFFLGRA